MYHTVESLKTDLINCELLLLKSVLNSITAMKIVQSAMQLSPPLRTWVSIEADDTTMLDAIAIYFLSTNFVDWRILWPVGSDRNHSRQRLTWSLFMSLNQRVCFTLVFSSNIVAVILLVKGVFWSSDYTYFFVFCPQPGPVRGSTLLRTV